MTSVFWLESCPSGHCFYEQLLSRAPQRQLRLKLQNIVQPTYKSTRYFFTFNLNRSWRQNVPPKGQWTSVRLRDVKFQNTVACSSKDTGVNRPKSAEEKVHTSQHVNCVKTSVCPKHEHVLCDGQKIKKLRGSNYRPLLSLLFNI
jgi:hypothetical protein